MTVANAGLFPTLDGNYRASRSHSLGHGSNAFSIGLNVSWTIDAGGRFAASEASVLRLLVFLKRVWEMFRLESQLKWPAPMSICGSLRSGWT